MWGLCEWCSSIRDVTNFTLLLLNADFSGNMNADLSENLSGMFSLLHVYTESTVEEFAF